MKWNISNIVFHLHILYWRYTFFTKRGAMRELSFVLRGIREMEALHKFPKLNMEVHPSAYKKALSDLRREGWIDGWGVTPAGKRLLLEEIKALAIDIVKNTPKFNELNVTEKTDAFHAVRVYMTSLTTLEALLADMMFFHMIESHLPAFVSHYVDNVALPRRAKNGTEASSPGNGKRLE